MYVYAYIGTYTYICFYIHIHRENRYIQIKNKYKNKYIQICKSIYTTHILITGNCLMLLWKL